MQYRRTIAWWWSRFELAIAIGVILAVVLDMLLSPGPMIWIGNPGGPHWVYLLPTAAYVAALLLAAIGFVWMIRILRGPRDDPPPWRYRR